MVDAPTVNQDIKPIITGYVNITTPIVYNRIKEDVINAKMDTM